MHNIFLTSCDAFLSLASVFERIVLTVFFSYSVMATGSEDLECVICNDNLVDPRALPCGHSYCGPPRLCLSALKNDQGGMRCAVCRTDHNLRYEDIKPLYGIRDYLLKGSATLDIPCPSHANKECTLWWNDCHLMICVDCIEIEHEATL